MQFLPIFYLVFFVILVIFFASFLILFLTLDRRVRKTLRDDYEIKDGRLFLFRIPTYARLAIKKGGWKEDKHIWIEYGDFDFRGFATKFESIAATIFIYSLYVLMAIAAFVAVTDILGIIDFDFKE